MIRTIALMLVLFCSLAAHADERILLFHSDIVIAADSTMTVTETIRVRAEGNRIRRGIYRDFPTNSEDDAGRTIHHSFELISATRDGAPETSRLWWTTAPIGLGLALWAARRGAAAVVCATLAVWTVPVGPMTKLTVTRPARPGCWLSCCS